jgi:hypothetical protein
MLLLPRQLDTQRTKRLSRRARRRHQALASGPTVSFPGAPMNGALSRVFLKPVTTCATGPF